MRFQDYSRGSFLVVFLAIVQQPEGFDRKLVQGTQDPRGGGTVLGHLSARERSQRQDEEDPREEK